ncbi:unnamed protein product [Schistosoma turkestanicum]|nr:unnamed protein product [Schistosoma turkestanicum]
MTLSLCKLCVIYLVNSSIDNEMETFVEQNPTSKILITFISVTVAVIIFFGNLLVLLAFALTKNLRREIDLYIASLAMADFLLSILILPLAIIRQHVGYWPFNSNLICQYFMSGNFLLCLASVLSLCCISIDRYIAVTRPLQYNRTRNHSRPLYMILGVWLLAFTSIALPYVFGYQHYYTGRACYLSYNTSIRLYIAVFVWFIPFLIIGFVHMLIFPIVRRHSLRHRHLIKAHTLILHQNESQHNRRQTVELLMTSLRKLSRKTSVLTESPLSDLDVFTNSLMVRFKILCKMSISDKLNDSLERLFKHRINHNHSSQISDHMHSKAVNHSGKEIRCLHSSLPSSVSLEPNIDENLILSNEIEESKNTKEQPSLQCIQKCNQMYQDKSENVLKLQYTDSTDDNLNSCGSYSISENTRQLKLNGFNLFVAADKTEKQFSQPFIDGSKENNFSLPEYIQHRATFRRELNALQIMLIVTSCFFICWLPFLFILLGELSCRCVFPEVIHVSISWLLYLNSCCNPFIYAFRNERYAKAFRQLLGTENCHRKIKLVKS